MTLVKTFVITKLHAPRPSLLNFSRIAVLYERIAEGCGCASLIAARLEAAPGGRAAVQPALHPAHSHPEACAVFSCAGCGAQRLFNCRREHGQQLTCHRVGRAAAIGGGSGRLLEPAPGASLLRGSFYCVVALLPADDTLSPAHVTEVPVRARRVFRGRPSPPGGQSQPVPHEPSPYAPWASAEARGSVTKSDSGVHTSLWGSKLQSKKRGPVFKFEACLFNYRGPSLGK